MNKKFSTLVASVLLVTNVGAYAQQVQVEPMAMDAPIAMTVTGTSVIPTECTGSETDPAYKVGQAYFLNTSNGHYLSIIDDKLMSTPASSFTTLADANKVLWILRSIDAPAGAIAPKYVFENKGTHAVLAMDINKAVPLTYKEDGTLNLDDVEAATVGGTTTEWLGALSYKIPTASPFYTALPNDSVATFILHGDNVGSGKVKFVKMKKSELTAVSQVIKFTPYQVGKTSNNTLVLSPKDLNTMLGKAGVDATKENFFKLSFNPAATTNGEDNLWAQDLQAVAVEQFDVKYGKDASKSTELIVPDKANTAFSTLNADDLTAGGFYTSLRPLWSNDLDEYTAANLSVEGETEAVNNGSPRWVTLRNRDGKYLVVDTAYIGGKNTAQSGSSLITFAMDDLYDSHNAKTRLRDPRSYLFQFIYNPVTDKVEIQSYAYVTQETDANKLTAKTPVPAEYYADNYVDPYFSEGSRWYSGANNVIEKPYIRRAALLSASEVTLQNASDTKNSDGSFKVPAGNAAFSIKLGNSSEYTLSAISSGAYLIKVTGSKDKKRIGKYWVDNLDGTFAIMEQAVRQNFQHMPAAQWMVKSAGSVVPGSPVISIVNREFGQEPFVMSNQSDEPDALKYVKTNGTLYDGGNGLFFMGGDTLQFIPVTDVKDATLGYKYVANDTIRESLFTFNYLHELAMDKPVNTKNDKDSVVWVDKNGDKMLFVLESVLAEDDTYGTTNEVAGVADLVRRAYRIKVSDASKLQNDKRYLCYDADQKKYLVSKREAADADIFFLKENNEVNGGSCYYTLLQANVRPVVTVETDDDGNSKIVARNGYMTIDVDVIRAITEAGNKQCYLAKYGKYTSESDGIIAGTEGWAIRTFSPKEKEALENAGWNSNNFDLIADVIGDGVNGEFTKIEDSHFVYRLTPQPDSGDDMSNPFASYALAKVSVDNNTLALVNGNLADNASSEVANSAFAVVRNADPLYRYFATTDTLKFFRVNAAAPEYLYEDAQSKYSADKGFNFLGVEGKGDNKLAAMYLDTAYVNRETRMPQYLIAVDPEIHVGDTVWCGEEHTNLADSLSCIHTKINPTYVDARYLVNLQDSVDLYAGNADYNLRDKYIYDRKYTRLGFVEARHIGDTLIIKNSAYTGNNNPIVAGTAPTWAGKDSIFLGNNMHKNAVFSFRIAKSGSDDFLIESETEGPKANSSEMEHKKNADLKAVRIAPNMGGWVKIQNGVPVIANNGIYNESGRDADVFNVETTSEQPTANEGISASDIEIVAGNGIVTVKNAAGKSVTISNILGKAVANAILTSDNATINVPAGIVVVSVEGEDAVKVVVK